jgi:hypothetical protein
MKPQQGQINDLNNLGIYGAPTIVCEAGSDNGSTFNGAFLAKIGRTYYRINNGELIKVIKK